MSKKGNGETMKKLWNRIARYRVLLLMSIVLAAATVIMQLYVPMLFGDAIDCIVAEHRVDFDRVGMFLGRVALFAVLAPMGICYPLILRKDLKRRRKEALKLQFKDAILSAASGLNAGYSVENAFAAALEEMDRLYGKDSMISQELRLILAKTRMNRAFGEALGDFARRSGLEDIQSFSEVFLAARKSGGELVRIIARTAEIIAEKIRIQEDIMTATAARRMEQRIMSAIPLLIVFYIELTSPGFFDLLYGTAAGRVVMTVCLGIYLGACSLSKRILEIRI